MLMRSKRTETDHLSLRGQANVGQLTNLAALQLTEEGYGSIACACAARDRC